VIVSERVDPRLYDPGFAWRALRWLTYRRAAAVVVQTARTRDYLAARLRARLVVIPNPVVPGPRTAASEPLVVAMGRLVPQKGFDVVIRAFARAADQLTVWRLIIAGVGPVRRALEARAEELGIEDRVALPGMVRDNYALLGRASIFVAASRFEGFPNALAEAMACGRAVVATDCPTGPRELTLDGTAGLLVRVDDHVAVSEALVRLGRDAHLRQRFGAAAAHAMTRYELGAVLKQWHDLLGG
jgi:glycosyltransferase involved in cell wall biosynthesis